MRGRPATLLAVLAAAGCGRSGLSSLTPPAGTYVPTPIFSYSPTPTPGQGGGFLVDSFSGTDGQTLETHSPDVGGALSWTPMTGTAAGSLRILSSGRVYANATGAFVYQNTTPPATCTGGDLPQQMTHQTGNATSDNCTLPANPALGANLVFVGGAVQSPLSGITGGGVTWVRADKSTQQTNLEIWYGEGSDASSATVTYSSGASGPMICWVGELSGLAATNSLDAQAIAAATGNSGPASPGSITTGAAQELVVFGASSFHPATFGAPSSGPWTILPKVTGPNGGADQVAFARKVAVLGTSVNPSLSVTGNGWDSAIAAFKAPGPGADYSVKATGRWSVLDPGNQVVLSARVQGSGNRYVLEVAGMGANNVVLAKYTPGRMVIHQTPQTIATGVDHLIELRVIGSSLSAFLDGVHITALDATDTTIPLPGTAAVGVSRNTTTSVTDVSASALDAGCL